MIRQIDNAEATQATRQPSATQVAPATAAGKSFASVLTREKQASGTTQSTRAKDAISAPEGEVWTPVKGHDHYARITDGPRKGLYINLSRGERRGETFTVENRDGKRVHVYGEGASQKVIPAAEDTGKVKHGTKFVPASQAAKGEQWAPVKGANNYADILSGSRNGLYVNTSGGIRDGMAFQIVKRDGKTFHVYGSGKHRQEIEVGTHKSTATSGDTSSTSTATGSSGSSTGGSSASGTTGGTPTA